MKRTLLLLQQQQLLLLLLVFILLGVLWLGEDSLGGSSLVVATALDLNPAVLAIERLILLLRSDVLLFC